MTGETIALGDAKQTAAGGEAIKSKRTVSSIEFPYNDLETAVGVARAAHNRAGMSACAIPLLAAELDHEVNSGTFRLKITAARMFGLIRVDRASVTVTELGRRLADERGDERGPDLDEAFLSVELYSALYKRYEGYVLPPAAALEREMAALGVSEKQKDKARQAFDRSARYAGFIAANGRFVRPPHRVVVTAHIPAEAAVSADASVQSESPIQPQSNKYGSGGDGGIGDLQLDPLIVGLLRRLPSPDRNWPARERSKWLQALAINLGIIYGSNEPVIDPVDVSALGGDK
jgi:hypothetical protein